VCFRWETSEKNQPKLGDQKNLEGGRGKPSSIIEVPHRTKGVEETERIVGWREHSTTSGHNRRFVARREENRGGRKGDYED